VRRPVKPDAAYVHALRRHFERCGFDGAPRYLGTDERGRAVFTFIEGFAPAAQRLPPERGDVASRRPAAPEQRTT
jgi:hypothetical protein